MPINFFLPACQTPIQDTLFGLCDPPGAHPAYVSTDTDETWVATVSNVENTAVLFTAIDNCISLLRDNNNQESRCDGMITYADQIVFVELKEVLKDWIPDGIEQLRTTIELFSENHNLLEYKKRRAFLANRKHPRFHHSHQEMMQHFRNETKVRLIIEATIII